MVTEAELLAAIYAAPASEEHRRVYADWLLEQSDPALRARGEYITLQFLGRPLTPEEQQRERALFAEHGRRWLGRLSPGLIQERSDRFVRGFLSHAEITTGKVAALRAVLDAPEWSTVVRLSTPLDNNLIMLRAEAELITRPQLRALREIRVSEEVFYALCRQRTPVPTLTSIELRTTYLADEVNRAIVARAECFPALTDLYLCHEGSEEMRWGPGNLDWLFATPIGRNLSVLRLDHVLPIRLPGWLAYLTLARPRLGNFTQLRLYRDRRWHDSVRVQRDDTGAFQELHFQLDRSGLVNDHEARFDFIVACLESAPTSVTAVTVSEHIAPAPQRRIEDATQRLPSLQRLAFGW